MFMQMFSTLNLVTQSSITYYGMPKNIVGNKLFIQYHEISDSAPITTRTVTSSQYHDFDDIAILLCVICESIQDSMC